MTNFTKSMVPDTVNSVEAVYVWAATVLSVLYADKDSIEGLDGNSEPVKTRCVQVGTVYLTAPDPEAWRHISRVSLGIQPEFQAGQAPWTCVDSLGNKAIPSSMRA